MTVDSVIFQHADEVAFLWEQRSQAVSSPVYRLQDLVQLDNRLDANIDGLRIAGDTGWNFVREQLSWPGPGEAFAAAVMAVDSGSPERLEEVLDLVTADGLDDDSADALSGLISSTGWFPFVRVRHQLERCLRSDSTAALIVGIGGAGIHRQDPGDVLEQALRSENPILRGQATKAVGELDRKDLIPQLRLADEGDERCQYYRAWSLALLGSDEASNDLQRIASGTGAFAERAADLAVRLMPVDDARQWLTELSQHPETTRIAAKGAGALGDPAVVTWLIGQMRQPEPARVAGLAFSSITGVDLEDDQLEGEAPEGFEAGPTDDTDDDFVGTDTDEDLPWPDPDLVEQWWTQNRDRYVNAQRYFLGEPAGVDAWRRALRHGSQLSRGAAAIELALAGAESVLFNVNAPGFRQIASLESLNHTNHD